MLARTSGVGASGPSWAGAGADRNSMLGDELGGGRDDHTATGGKKAERQSRPLAQVCIRVFHGLGAQARKRDSCRRAF